MKRKIAGLFALLLTVATAVTGCSGRITLDGTAEAASVNGVSIPLSEVNFYLRYQQAQMQSMYGAYFGEDFMSQDLMGTEPLMARPIRDTVVGYPGGILHCGGQCGRSGSLPERRREGSRV